MNQIEALDQKRFKAFFVELSSHKPFVNLFEVCYRYRK